MHSLLAIDQGTSSTRAIVYDTKGVALAHAHQEFAQYYPQDGWVEHDANEIWHATLTVVRKALATAAATGYQVIACGITNQRETTVIWDKVTGEVLHRAIVWQDRRTHATCQQLRHHEALVQYKTGLLIDPYFSATKLQWLLKHVPKAADYAAAGRLAFGTIDSFLIWKFTNGAVHATDATNASRTLLFNIRTQQWDPELLALFEIPSHILPQVLDCNAHFGMMHEAHSGYAIAITGVVGDQQAATIGQACFEAGMLKATYGTGGFLLLNTAAELITSANRLLGTILYRINNKVTYGLEGSIFNAGTAIKWLRDDLQLITSASETEALAAAVPDNGGVYVVPAFTGLGAPYWDATARAAILGMQRSSNRAHVARAVLESVCYQTQDVLNCMRSDYGKPIKTLRVDGGMVVNNWLMQYLADTTDITIQRCRDKETTALGAAIVAGLGVGLYQSLQDAATIWHYNQQFEPNNAKAMRELLYQQWQQAVARVRNLN